MEREDSKILPLPPTNREWRRLPSLAWDRVALSGNPSVQPFFSLLFYFQTPEFRHSFAPETGLSAKAFRSTRMLLMSVGDGIKWT